MARPSKKQGKRRATSPATRESSLERVSRQFKAQFARPKRIKIEPGLSAHPDPAATNQVQLSSVQGSAAEQDTGPVGEKARTSTQDARPRGRRATLGAEVRADGVPADGKSAASAIEQTSDEAVADEPPTDFLQILSKGSTSDKVTRALVDDLVDRAFRTPTTNAGEAPASRYVERSVEGILTNKPSDEQMAKLDRLFHEAWLQRMALHTGGHIKSAQQLRDVLSTIATSLPFQLRQDSPLSRFLNDMPDILTSAGGTGDDRAALLRDNAHGTLRYLQPLAADSIDNGAPQTVPRTPESQNTEFRDSMPPQPVSSREVGTPACRRDTGPGSAVDKRELAHSQTTKSESVDELKNRFPKAFDVFVYHINHYRRFTAAEPLHGTPESEDFKQRARDIFKSLGPDTKRYWKDIRKRIHQGDSTALNLDASREVLVRQGVVDQLGPNRKVIAVDYRPQFIPMPSPQSHDNMTGCRLMIVGRDAQGSRLDISAAAVNRACSLAFDPKLPYPAIEKWSDDIYVAKFDSVANASRAKDAVVVINKHQLTAEHLHAISRPPVAFTCSIFHVSVSREEIALRIAQAFPEHISAMTVRVQHSSKRHAGTHVSVSFRIAPRLVRFYLPMQQEYSEEVFVACFKPWNPRVKCVFCRNHDMPKPSDCAHAKLISLPNLE